MELTGTALVKRIKEELRARKLKTQDLCQYAGLYSNTFTNWTSRNTIPSADVLYKIARFLDVPMEYLLTGKADTDEELCAHISSLTPEHKETIKNMILFFMAEEKKDIVEENKKKNTAI